MTITFPRKYNNFIVYEVLIEQTYVVDFFQNYVLEGKMDSKDLKKILAGVSIAGLLSTGGIALTALAGSG